MNIIKAFLLLRIVLLCLIVLLCSSILHADKDQFKDPTLIDATLEYLWQRLEDIKILIAKGEDGNATRKSLREALEITQMTSKEALLIEKSKDGVISNYHRYGSGGVLDLIVGLNSVQYFVAGKEDLKFENNSATGFGGVLYMSGGVVAMFTNAKFLNNKAITGQGGAFFLKDNAAVVFLANGLSKTVFKGNTASGNSNAIHIGKNSEVRFVIGNGSSVEMHDALSNDGDANGNLWTTGQGDFNLYATSMLDGTNIVMNKGISFNLKGGVDLTAKTIESDEVSTLNMSGHAANSVDVKERLSALGKIEMGVYNNGKCDKITVNELNLNEQTSKLKVSLRTRRLGRGYCELINYKGKIGAFAESNMVFDEGLWQPSPDKCKIRNVGGKFIMEYNLETSVRLTSIPNLTEKQKAVAEAFDKLSKTRPDDDVDKIISAVDMLKYNEAKAVALAKIDGSFLANAIRSGGSENDSKKIFARINSRSKEEKPGVWGQVKVAYTKYSEDDKSLGDYIDNEKGGLIGYDRYVAQNKFPGKLTLGAYAKVNNHSMLQGSANKGNITNAGIGMYSSYEEEKWEVKAMIDGSYDMYNTEREISFRNISKIVKLEECKLGDYLDGINRTAKADFTGSGIGCNLEGALKVKLSGTSSLKPYLGLDARTSHYSSIKEKGADGLSLNTETGNYNRVFVKTGLAVEQKIGKFGWNVNVEYKRLLSNNLPEITSAFEGRTDAELRTIGTEEGKNVVGMGAGGSYKITENTAVFAGANIFSAKHYQSIQGNVGVSYRFGPSDRRTSRKNRKKMSKEEKETAKVRAKLNKYLYGALKDKLLKN